MKKSEALFGLLRIPADVLAAGAALFLSFRLRQANIDLLPFVRLLEPAQTLPTAEYYVSAFILPAVLLFVALAAALKLYALRATMSAWTEMGHVVLAAALWVAVVNAWFFLVEHELFFSRAVLVHSVAFLILFVAVFRSWLILVQRAFLRRGVGRLLVVSLGSQAIAVPARDVLLHDMHYHYLGHLQDLAALKRVIHQQVIDFVIQTDPNPGSQETVALIEYCRSHHLGYGFLPPVLADVPHQLAVDRLGRAAHTFPAHAAGRVGARVEAPLRPARERGAHCAPPAIPPPLCTGHFANQWMAHLLHFHAGGGAGENARQNPQVPHHGEERRRPQGAAHGAE